MTKNELKQTYTIEKRMSKTSGKEILDISFGDGYTSRKVIVTNKTDAESQLGLLGRDLYAKYLSPEPTKTLLWQKSQFDVSVKVERWEHPDREATVFVDVRDRNACGSYPWSSGWNHNDVDAAIEVAKVLYAKLLLDSVVKIGPDGYAYVEPDLELAAYNDSFE